MVCTVSSMVRPVTTRVVSVRSSGRIRCHAGMSVDSGTFSGSQKLAVNRFHTSRSLPSGTRFQFTGRRRAVGSFRQASEVIECCG